MLMIRLQRVGRKHEPVFRLVLTDSKNSTKSGRFLEILGSYDARKAEDAKFDNEKILLHLSKGAQLSDTVHNLLLKRGVIQGTKRNVLSRKPADKVIEPATEVTTTTPEVLEAATETMEAQAEPASAEEISSGEAKEEVENKEEVVVE